MLALKCTILNCLGKCKKYNIESHCRRKVSCSHNNILVALSVKFNLQEHCKTASILNKLINLLLIKTSCLVMDQMLTRNGAKTIVNEARRW